MPDFDVVDLSRLQFALTALYHFLFVPLTLGLSVLLAIMESVYVMTGRVIWRDMTKFWGMLFGINFAMGVATGITMEFQFGTNWAYYAHYVGDVFGAPLAIEGLMAFFLEATFIGLFFFGWDRLSKVGHVIVTWLVAIGSNLSALWILIANGWMQNPVGAQFNPATMRMEVASFYDVLFNPVAQAKFVHTVSAGYVTGSMFVLSISALYLLRGRHVEIAKRSMTVAASFGLASALSVVVLGDESGYTAGLNQKMKIASIEAMWETEPAPASFTIFGLPDRRAELTHFAIRVPWVLGPDRDAFAGHAGPRHQGACPGRRAAHPGRSRRLSRCSHSCAPSTRPACRRRCSASMQRSRLCAAAEAVPAGYRERDPRPDPPRGAEHGARCLHAVLVVPDHGRARLVFHRCCSRSHLRCPRCGSSTAGGFCRSRSGACRCPGSPPNSAGSSPNTAASRGSSTGCCRRFSACRTHRPAISGSASAVSCCFTARWRSSTCYLMIKYVRIGPDEPRPVLAAAGH